MTSEPEPLSWLLLERYALGEVSPEERTAVEARLSASARDRARLQEIVQDASELPPLPVPAPPAPASLAEARAKRGKLGSLIAVSVSLSAAAAAALLLWQKPKAPEYDGVKGSHVAVRLISDRQGANPHTFSLGERFKVEVSCPASRAGSLRILVFQGNERFEPLPEAPDFPCGNRAPWPGAFTLDGEQPADVCVYWGESASPTRAALGDAAVCATLAPAR